MINTNFDMSATENNLPDDPVNHPSHYTVGGMEAIDVIQAKLTPEQFRGFLLGNVLKYSMRHNYKQKSLEDSGKAAWYLNKLIHHLESKDDKDKERENTRSKRPSGTEGERECEDSPEREVSSEGRRGSNR